MPGIQSHPRAFDASVNRAPGGDKIISDRCLEMPSSLLNYLLPNSEMRLATRAGRDIDDAWHELAQDARCVSFEAFPSGVID